MSVPVLSRTPEHIGRHLEADLQRCASHLEDALPTIRQRIRSPSSLTSQRIHQNDLDAALEIVSSPWFGYIHVREDGTERVYRIGRAGHAALRIVDWRHALARIFYEEEPGDVYERPGGGRTIEGRLQARARVIADVLALESVEWFDEQGALRITRQNGRFVDMDGTDRVDAPVIASTQGLGDILAYITRDQWELITQASDQPLIIQGKAGSGKTTVALHRLAYLAYTGDDDESRPDRAFAVDPKNTLIVMFNAALCAFVAQSLENLELKGARLETFHRWALSTIQGVYGGKIEVRTDELPGAETAARLKAQKGILDAIERYADNQAQRFEGWLSEKLEPYDASWIKAWKASTGPLVPRLIELRKKSLKARDEASTRRRSLMLDQVYRVFRYAISRMTLYKEDLRRILTDSTLLTLCLPHQSADDIAALCAYQDLRQRHGAPEGRQVGHAIDFDDLALLLRIMQAKHGGLPTSDERVFHFDHVVIDEAQDFGAVELKVLLDAVRSRTGVTIVGDINQKIVPHVKFMGWEALTEELGVDGAQVAKLTVGHRSTAPIVSVCDAIVGVEVRVDDISREGPLPCAWSTADEQETLSWLLDTIEARLAERADIHIAVVTRYKRTADRIFEPLSQELGEFALPVRRGNNTNFAFKPGVTVTNLRQIKGLEFDTVLAMEFDADAYPDTEQGRRDAYVLCSRAQERLGFVGHGQRSPLLRKLIDQGLVEQRKFAVPLVVLEEDALDEPF